MQSKKTQFLASFFHNNLARSEHEQCCSRRGETLYFTKSTFSKKVRKLPPKTLPKPLQNQLKIKRKTTTKTSLDWRGRSFSDHFRPFPTFSDLFPPRVKKFHLEARSFAIPLKLPLVGLRLPNGIAHTRFP